MRILIIASSYYPYKGGVETVVGDLVNGLKSQGDQAMVITNLWPKSLPLFQRLSGTSVFRVPMIVPTQSSHNFVNRLKWLITTAITSILVTCFKPQVINIQCVGPNGYWGKGLSKRFNIPIVVSTHGERTNDSSGFYLVKENVEIYEGLISSAKAVVCVSEVSAKESITPYEVNTDNSVMIPNAITIIDQETITPDRPFDIVYVGRLVAEKGVDTLIEAVARLRQGFPNVTVKIVGSGPAFEQLNQLVVESGLTENVIFVGQLDRNGVRQVLLSSKILVLPSRKESFGLVLLEAANAGCAVVATSTGGIPSIVEHGQNGLLFEIDSIDQLVAHLASLLVDESRRLELVAQFSNRLPLYDIKNFVSRYRTVFMDVATR
jgi:glycosyltransferase involved in cell wall biosynthesis